MDINEDFLTFRITRAAIVSAPSDGALRLALIILLRCGSQSHTQASHKDLANAGGWTMRTFQRHLASLVSARWIRVQRLGPGEPAVLHLAGPLSQRPAKDTLTDPYQHEESPQSYQDSPHGESEQISSVEAESLHPKNQIAFLSSEVATLRAELTTLAEAFEILRSKTSPSTESPTDLPSDPPKNSHPEISPASLQKPPPPPASENSPPTITPTRQKQAHNQTQGALALRQWIEAQNTSRRRTASLIGVHSSAVDRWLTGQRAPSPPQRQLIATLTNIPPEAWDTSASHTTP